MPMLGSMSTAPHDLPQSAEELARRGVLTHITMGGERIALIVPASLMDTLRILAALLKTEPAAEELPDLLPAVYDWAKWLPPHERKAFAAELGEALRRDGDDAAEAMDRVTDAWRATAEVYSDEDVLSALRLPVEDHGPVPEPVAP